MNLHNLELESVYAKGEDGEFHLVARRDECETKATAEKEYIERGEAEKRLFQRAEIANSAYIDQTPSQIMMLAQNVVHLIPAADVRPVVRGKWLTGNDNPRSYGRIRAMCGRCGAFALAEMVNAGSYKEQLSNYCPNCGARMEES